MFVLPEKTNGNGKAAVKAKKAKAKAKADVKTATKAKKALIKSPAKKPQLRSAPLEQVVLGIRSKTPEGNTPKSNFQEVQTVNKVAKVLQVCGSMVGKKAR